MVSAETGSQRGDSCPSNYSLCHGATGGLIVELTKQMIGFSGVGWGLGESRRKSQTVDAMQPKYLDF